MDNLDTVRATIMQRIDRAERNTGWPSSAPCIGRRLPVRIFSYWPTSTIEHVLLLLGTVMSCSVIVLGLVALGAHVNRGFLRVLQAIDATRGQGR